MTGIYESIPATPEEVESFGATLTDAYLHCRVWGHDPDPQGNTRLATDSDGVTGAYWVVSPSCTHGCGVRWNIFATADGDVVRRALDYSDAPDYLSNTGRIDAQGRSVLRKEFFMRSVGAKPQKKATRKRAGAKRTTRKKAS